jgi:hypothetical protein
MDSVYAFLKAIPEAAKTPLALIHGLDAELTFVLALRKSSREWLRIRKAEVISRQVSLWMQVNRTYDATTSSPSHNAPRLFVMLRDAGKRAKSRQTMLLRGDAHARSVYQLQTGT